MAISDDIGSIRRRLQSVQKELRAIKEGTWAGVIRYDQIKDGDPEFAAEGDPEEKISGPSATAAR
jgi:hypothetical protein